MDKYRNIQLFLAVSPQQLNAISLSGWRYLPETYDSFCQPQGKLAQAQQQAKKLYQDRDGAAYVVRLTLKPVILDADQDIKDAQAHLSSQQQAWLNQQLSGHIELASAFNTACQSEISHDEFMFLYG